MRLSIAFFVAFSISILPLATAATTYSYDSLNRVTRVTYPDGTTIAYTYDSTGNRLSQIISSPSIPLPQVTVDKSTLTFSAPAGQPAVAQTIAVTNGGGGSLQWDAVATANWLSATPGTGTNSGSVSITASAAGLSGGTYNGGVTILASASNSPVTVAVVFTVTPPLGNPTISSGGIVSAAGATPGIARGSIASLFGTALADAAASATTVPLPLTLGNVQVSVNGVSAPLWYAGSGQINFQVPFESPLQGTAPVIVTRDGVASSPVTVALAPYAPSVFTYERVAGVFDPIIVHAANNQLVTPTSPAAPGEYIIIYGTGVGDLSVLPATGGLSPANPPATAKVTPTATVGGVNAAVTFAGLTPGAVGLAQFNVQVPSSLPTGPTAPLVISFNGVASDPVTLAVNSAASAPTIITITGNGMKGYSGDGGSATSAAFNQPTRVVADATGNYFVVDNDNNRIRKVDVNGIVTTVAGDGQNGFGGDGGPATAASLSFGNNPQLFPGGIAVDGGGNIYFSDVANNRIRKVSTNGTITTVAGNGGGQFSGDGGPAVSASLYRPQGLAIDGSGNLFIADTYNHRIRKVDSSGTITTVAGNGGSLPLGDGAQATSAFLSVPTDVAVDGSSNLYIVDYADCRIRKVNASGVIDTVAGEGCVYAGFGGDGGPATAALLYGPQGVAVDANGIIYIADVGNNRIRSVALDGTITTAAGTGVGGFSGDGGSPILAQLALPTGVAIDTFGNILIADSLNSRVRIISSNLVIHK